MKKTILKEAEAAVKQAEKEYRESERAMWKLEDNLYQAYADLQLTFKSHLAQLKKKDDLIYKKLARARRRLTAVVQMRKHQK